jgi:hypothetical protein
MARPFVRAATRRGIKDVRSLQEFKWVPRPISLPGKATAELTSGQTDLLDELIELKNDFDEVDDLFNSVYDLLDKSLANMSLIPDPADKALAKSLESFGSPGKITKEVIDRANLVLAAPMGILPYDIGSTKNEFYTSSNVFESCQHYSEAVRAAITGSLNPNSWVVSSAAGYNDKVQSIGRKKAIKMVWLAIMEFLIDLLEKMLKPLTYTPARPAVKKMISKLRKANRDAQRNLLRVDPIGQYSPNTSATRYEIWMKISTIRWSLSVPTTGVEWDVAMDASGKPYQKVSDIPPSYIRSILLEPDNSGEASRNLGKTYYGWDRVSANNVTSYSYFSLPLIPRPSYNSPLSSVVQYFVIDTTVQYMDQDSWTIKYYPTEVDEELRETANDCTAHAMRILNAADSLHLEPSLDEKDYPSQTWSIYRTLGSVRSGYDAAKTITKSTFIASSNLFEAAGLDSSWIDSFGKEANDHTFGWAEKQLSEVYRDYQDLMKKLPDLKDPNNVILGKTLFGKKWQRDMTKRMLGSIKTLLRSLEVDLKNWMHDRTILCCFLQNTALSARKWRPYIKILRLAISLLRNKGANLIKATLADLLDIGKLIYNTAVSVVLALLQALIQTGINWARNAVEKEFTSVMSPKNALQCLPLKAFAFSILGGLELIEQEIMAYLKDFFTMQDSAIKMVQIASEQSKFNDWLDHIDKALAALDVALQNELICKNGIAVNAVDIPDTGANLTIDISDPIERPDIVPMVISTITEKIDESNLSSGPISTAELIQFYQSFMHYTPAQISQAMTGDWTDTKERMAQLAMLVPEFNTMVGNGTCLDKLSAAERQEAEQRIQQLQELENRR